MTLAQATKVYVAKLTAAGVQGAKLDAELLIAYVTGKNRAWVLAHPEESLTTTQTTQLEQLVAKRAARHPLVHLTGNREFYGLNFAITPDVLTPRVETEQMVEWVIADAPKNARCIDIGTGSGAIAVAIVKHRPDIEMWATDVTDEALAVAKRNIKAHSVEVKLLKSDLFERVDAKFDVVATNLPYLQDDADLMPEVQKEPAVALHGGKDGLTLYRRFLKQLPAHLKPDGKLYTECDPWQQADLAETAAEQGLAKIRENYFIMGFQEQS